MTPTDDTSGGRPPKPTPGVTADAIPEGLRAQPTWVGWRYVWNDDQAKWDKVPIQATQDEYASATNPGTWSDFETTLAAYHERADLDGIGYVFTEDGPAAGVDLDNAHDPATGQTEPWARDIITRLESYTEYSPSGTGYHVLAVGTKPDGRCKATVESTLERFGDAEVEIYDAGRFFTVTGGHLADTPETVNQRPDDLHAVWSDYVARGEDTANDALAATRHAPNTTLDDQQVLAKARSATNGEKFEALWNGSDAYHHNDTSAADLALCQQLAFWTGGDHHQMDRLFRQSNRLREKWDEQHSADGDTYGELTLKQALANTTELYDPGSAAGDGPAPPTSPGSTDDATPTESALVVHDGGYAYRVETDDGVRYDRVTNFTLEVLSRLVGEDGTRTLHLRVIPRDPDLEAPYEVAVAPSVFNEPRTFKADLVTGVSTTFSGGYDALNELRLVVAHQDAPERRAVDKLGIHRDGDHVELVTPAGSLTAAGWSDDPTFVFTGDAPATWRLDPADGADYDREAVAAMLELLPQTRDPERFLPALGWFYTAPLRPYVQAWAGEFNVLNILGDTGAGKTTTLEVLQSLFGFAPDLRRVETPFPTMMAMASSRLPVVFDEYKPADLKPKHRDAFHNYARTSTRGGLAERGRPDQTTDQYWLDAPVCVAGEQPFGGPAEERRRILTTFTREDTTANSDAATAFTTLTNDYDLADHARAYYRWVLGQDTAALRARWDAAHERVAALLADLGLAGLDDLVVQGYVTVAFGCDLFRAFATAMGVDADTTPVTDATVRAAIAYLTTEGTGAQHRSHLQVLLNLLDRALAAGYLQEGEHYTVVNEGRPTEYVGIKMDRAFDKVRKYVRVHDLRGEEVLDSYDDYRARIRDAAADPDSPVLKTSEPTHALQRCVAFAPDTFDALCADDEVVAADAATAFAFTRLEPYGDGIYSEAFEATVTGVDRPAPWLAGQGTLQDATGTTVKYEVLEGVDPGVGFEAGRTYRFETVGVETNDAGVATVKIQSASSVTEVARTPADAHQTDLARSDGGAHASEADEDETDSQADRLERLVDVVRATDGITRADLAGRLRRDPEAVADDVAMLTTRGVLAEYDEGELRVS